MQKVPLLKSGLESYIRSIERVRAMADVVITDLDPKARRERARRTKLQTKRVRDAEGKTRTLYVIDSQRPDLGDQMLKLFQLNVTRARRENAKHKPIAAE